MHARCLGRSRSRSAQTNMHAGQAQRSGGQAGRTWDGRGGHMHAGQSGTVLAHEVGIGGPSASVQAACMHAPPAARPNNAGLMQQFGRTDHTLCTSTTRYVRTN